MASERLLPLKDFPDKILAECTRRIWHYTIGFVRVEKTRQGQDAILVGSGVLVRVDGHLAILTADHVLENLPRSERVGLILSDRPEQTTIDVSQIEYITIDRGEDKGDGPDIGFIRLSPQISSTLYARKSFFNMDLRRDQLLNSPPDTQEGIWAAQGFVEEKTIEEPDPSPFQRVKAFCQFGAFGGVDDYSSIDQHDYYRFPLTVPASDVIPEDFGGMSGGGLWQVRIRKTKSGELEVAELLLQGVCFWQQHEADGVPSIICHGPRSIYDVAHAKIRKRAA